MSKLLIRGRNKLNGQIRIGGAKNAVLPILAATVLNGGENILFDSPDLRDVHSMIEILRSIGCKVSFENSVLTVNSSTLSSHEIPEHLVREMRSSIFLMGPMLGRCGKIKISYPGGCEIGPRPIDLHLKALRELGVKITEAHGFLECEAIKLEGKEIHLDYPSVGATENIMLVAVLAKGITKIRNAAKEPEIVDLQNYLNRMGAKIRGAGTSEIIIEGVDKLYGLEHKIIPDRIVAGTIATAGAIAGGEIILNNVVVDHMKPILLKLKEAGCWVFEKNNSLKIKSSQRLKAVEMTKTLPYPGFPTDMQAQFMALMTIARGTSIITETVFENRFKHVDELIRMGAKIKIDGRVAVIQGVKKLTGAKVFAKDLRGGAALVLAGLTAEGTTIVDNIKHIDRGYEQLDKMLKELGADIKRID
ncbi:UDP-N-acetylglucosamine 1-carboxyvinyltransferase [Crassaminicella thermophila]|uniref:UDP-N-acetylglucosamine 1-carboxyvinyltransferase n=1 Tax=Crassaminicella thermophila TaxID=2599308 RepID=A0A5C0SF69_CRATE|nr:UDP-N-acetylglucosamine 1-carboxyvinyltransferase [Crassaminicella thermophila]QEK11954.1 UDP-N-acetylglucosamine 1-carboxyvinyltransferase [Crassaminicella thermophila]